MKHVKKSHGEYEKDEEALTMVKHPTEYRHHEKGV